MTLWPFRKKESQAPLEINRNFYLSVLLVGARPSVLQWINPDGSNGAVKGFAAPLQQGKSADLLAEPIADGSYAVATLDRKTVLQTDFFNLEDVPEFKIPADSTTRSMADLQGEKLVRAESATGLATFLFKGHSADTYAAVRFLSDAVTRLAALSDGVIADPLAETYRLPSEFRQSAPLDSRIDFRDVGSVKAIQQADGVWVSIRGLSKFNLAEYEVYGQAPDQVTAMGELLILGAQEALLGRPMPLGPAVQTPFGRFRLIEGTKNRAVWADRATIELVREY
jgi:hypothetical protein